jgi:hypothetical protein
MPPCVEDWDDKITLTDSRSCRLVRAYYPSPPALPPPPASPPDSCLSAGDIAELHNARELDPPLWCDEILAQADEVEGGCRKYYVSHRFNISRCAPPRLGSGLCTRGPELACAPPPGQPPAPPPHRPEPSVPPPPTMPPPVPPPSPASPPPPPAPPPSPPPTWVAWAGTRSGMMDLGASSCGLIVLLGTLWWLLRRMGWRRRRRGRKGQLVPTSEPVSEHANTRGRRKSNTAPQKIERPPNQSGRAGRRGRRITRSSRTGRSVSACRERALRSINPKGRLCRVAVRYTAL